MTRTLTKFFFVNLPLITPPSNEYTSTVTNLGDPTQKIRFKYTVYDWNNEDLYIFQLDRQRQLTGKDYQMEYSRVVHSTINQRRGCTSMYNKTNRYVKL